MNAEIRVSEKCLLLALLIAALHAMPAPQVGWHAKVEITSTIAAR